MEMARASATSAVESLVSAVCAVAAVEVAAVVAVQEAGVAAVVRAVGAPVAAGRERVAAATARAVPDPGVVDLVVDLVVAVPEGAEILRSRRRLPRHSPRALPFRATS